MTEEPAHQPILLLRPVVGAESGQLPAANLVGAAIDMVTQEGPALGRPLVDHIKTSRHKNMKELRPGGSGDSEVRILFCFDPKRSAILLMAGDRNGRWKDWYETNIPLADDLVRHPPTGAEGTAVMVSNRQDVRTRANLDEVKVAEHRDRMISEIRAARLAEVRQRHEMSQTQVAERMGVSQARVSAIEKGELPATEIGTIAKYIAAIGGQLQIVADFGDEKLILG
ncbi:type II toxin-antitoxin system RelE/ParE family toxin [Micromonospora sp. NPDC020750]|uniref:type II toxin-antitoxin system RelE/ParE family toxin n=1 Tax=unclassified Micromonospora TaxID=2617518 RepID=UPI00379C18DB